MITHSTSTTSHLRYAEENHIDIRSTTGLTKENHAIVSVHRIIKWFGAISTILLSAVAIAPEMFRIPTNLQPWVFLVAIFWVLVFCTGMFDL